MPFNIGTLSEAVLIDGDVENYTITGMDCTEIKDPQRCRRYICAAYGSCKRSWVG